MRLTLQIGLVHFCPLFAFLLDEFLDGAVVRQILCTRRYIRHFHHRIALFVQLNLAGFGVNHIHDPVFLHTESAGLQA